VTPVCCYEPCEGMEALLRSRSTSSGEAFEKQRTGSGGVGSKRPREDLEDLVPPPPPASTTGGTGGGGDSDDPYGTFPELDSATRKALVDQRGLIVVGPPCFVKLVSGVIKEALGQLPVPSSVATVIACATTDGNMLKIRKATSCYGNQPMLVVISQKENEVWNLCMGSWCPLRLGRCTLYRNTKVSEVFNFLTLVASGTWPRALRGRPRPPHDAVSSFPHLKWAVQCSFRELVHDAPNTDVLTVFWHEECVACGEAMNTLEKLFSAISKLIKELNRTGAGLSPVPTEPTEAGERMETNVLAADSSVCTPASPPLCCVACNIVDNELDATDWSPTEGSKVPEIRLYPAGLPFLKQSFSNRCLSNSNLATPVGEGPASFGTGNSYPESTENLNSGLLPVRSLPVRTYVTFNGVRSVENLLGFLRSECKNEGSQTILATLSVTE
jgi:hypothetical protein